MGALHSSPWRGDRLNAAALPHDRVLPGVDITLPIDGCDESIAGHAACIVDVDRLCLPCARQDRQRPHGTIFPNAGVVSAAFIKTEANDLAHVVAAAGETAGGSG